MKFFDSFWKSSFYKEGKATSFWRSFGKVTLVTFVVSIVYATLFYVAFGMHIPAHLYTYGINALNGYPSGLVVTIQDDTLSKNSEGELHLYPISDGKIGEMKIEEVLPGYVVAINDTVSASLESYKNANALIFLAKDGLVVQGNDEMQIFSYSELLHGETNAVLTKDMISGIVATVNEHAKSIPWILVASIIILYSLFAPIGYLLLGLFNGLIIMLFSSYIIKKKATYSESYIYGMYALAPVIIVNGVLLMIPYVKDVAMVIPFFGTFLVVGFLLFMFRDEKVTPKVEVKVKPKVDEKIVEVREESADEVVTPPKKQVRTRKKKSEVV